MVSKSSVMNRFCWNNIRIHRWGSLMDRSLQGLNLDSLVSWMKDNLWEELDSLSKKLRLKRESELGEFSRDINIEFSSKRLYKLFDLIFWVFCSAAESSLSYEIGNWAIVKSFLSTSSFNQNSNAKSTYTYAGCPLFQTSEATLISFESLWCSLGLTALSASGISPCGNSPKSTSLCLLNWRFSLRAGAVLLALVTWEKHWTSLLANLAVLIIYWLNIKWSTW